MAESYQYDVFGKVTVLDNSGSPIANSAYSNRFMFTGREWIAEVGLYDYRNRVYSVELGRFLQTDPIRFDAGDVNLYRYLANSPVRLFDPLGLEDKSSGSSTGLLSGDLVIFGGPGFSFRVLTYFGKCDKPCVVFQICFRASIGMMAGIGGWTNKSILKNVDETSDTESGVNSSAQIGPITLQRNDGGINRDDPSSSGMVLAFELGIGAIWGAEKCITISQSGEGCQ